MTPMTSRPRPSPAAAATDTRPLGIGRSGRCFDPIEVRVEDVVEDDPAAVKTGRRQQEPAETGAAKPGNGITGKDIGEGRGHVHQPDGSGITTIPIIYDARRGPTSPSATGPHPHGCHYTHSRSAAAHGCARSRRRLRLRARAIRSIVDQHPGCGNANSVIPRSRDRSARYRTRLTFEASPVLQAMRQSDAESRLDHPSCRSSGRAVCSVLCRRARRSRRARPTHARGDSPSFRPSRSSRDRLRPAGPVSKRPARPAIGSVRPSARMSARTSRRSRAGSRRGHPRVHSLAIKVDVDQVQIQVCDERRQYPVPRHHSQHSQCISALPKVLSGRSLCPGADCEPWGVGRVADAARGCSTDTVRPISNLLRFMLGTTAGEMMGLAILTLPTSFYPQAPAREDLMSNIHKVTSTATCTATVSRVLGPARRRVARHHRARAQGGRASGATRRTGPRRTCRTLRSPQAAHDRS